MGGAGGEGRGEESANFRFEGIVGSSHGLRRAPHLSPAPAPALGSRPRVHCSRHSPGGGGDGPATMVSAGARGGGADPGIASSPEAPAAPGPGAPPGMGAAPPRPSGSPGLRASVALGPGR